MTQHRRAVLLTLLAMALAVLLVDVHGDLRRLRGDLRDTWNDMRGMSAPAP